MLHEIWHCCATVVVVLRTAWYDVALAFHPFWKWMSNTLWEFLKPVSIKLPPDSVSLNFLVTGYRWFGMLTWHRCAFWGGLEVMGSWLMNNSNTVEHIFFLSLVLTQVCVILFSRFSSLGNHLAPMFWNCGWSCIILRGNPCKLPLALAALPIFMCLSARIIAFTWFQFQRWTCSVISLNFGILCTDFSTQL